MKKVKVLLVGKVEPEIVRTFIELLLERGPHLIEIAKSIEEGELEVNVTELCQGTVNLDLEVNRVLASALKVLEGEKKFKRAKKKAKFIMRERVARLKKKLNNGSK